MNRKTWGLVLIAAGLGYTAYRANMAHNAGLALDAWFKNNYATSGAVPSAVAVAAGAYFYFKG